MPRAGAEPGGVWLLRTWRDFACVLLRQWRGLHVGFDGVCWQACSPEGAASKPASHGHGDIVHAAALVTRECGDVAENAPANRGDEAREQVREAAVPHRLAQELREWDPPPALHLLEALESLYRRRDDRNTEAGACSCQRAHERAGIELPPRLGRTVAAHAHRVLQRRAWQLRRGSLVEPRQALAPNALAQSIQRRYIAENLLAHFDGVKRLAHQHHRHPGRGACESVAGPSRGHLSQIDKDGLALAN